MMLNCDQYSYLSVKWIHWEVIRTLEVMSVRLTHYQAVLGTFESLSLKSETVKVWKSWVWLIIIATFEDVYLVNLVKPTRRTFSLSVNHNPCLPFPIYPKSRCVLLVCVFVDNFGQPQFFNFFFFEGVQWCAVLQILEFCSVLLPFQSDRKLDIDGVIFLFNVHQLQNVHRYGHRSFFILRYDWRDILIVAFFQH